MTTWYDPDEIKDEADGLQRQPEWTPKHDLLGEVFGDTEGGISEALEALAERVNEVESIVDSIIRPNQ